MDVALLYFDGCPSWHDADARLREALDALGRQDVAVKHVCICTPAQAEAAQFCGSPTVLVDGRDPFGDPSHQVGLSCRLYRTEHGLAGSPTVGMLIEALR